MGCVGTFQIGLFAFYLSRSRRAFQLRALVDKGPLNIVSLEEENHHLKTGWETSSHPLIEDGNK